MNIGVPAVPMKWRKYLALVDFGFVSADELAADIRRYPISEDYGLASSEFDSGTAAAPTSTQPPFLYTQVSIKRQRFNARLPFSAIFFRVSADHDGRTRQCAHRHGPRYDLIRL